MDNSVLSYATIDEYIALFPEGIREKLTRLRRLIHETAPEAIEKISYRMPTFYLNGNLIHFAVQTHHIGIYPGESGIAHFQHEFGNLIFSKGTLQIPLEEEMPWDLIRKITEFRREENLRKKKASRK